MPKKRSSHNYAPAILLGSLLGTYLDLYFVGRGVYEFPNRPFSSIFPIHIGFTLFVIPFLLLIFLILVKRMKPAKVLITSLFISLTLPTIEKLSEQWGFFYHSDKWKHTYSIYGYFIFLVSVWLFFKFSNRDAA
nr:CBO0543 family protein [Bacillus sp. FJAT-50079]